MTARGGPDSYFNREAEDYARRSEGRWWQSLRRAEERVLLELLDPRPGEAILDAGAGAGYYTGLLHDRGVQVSALDASPAMTGALARRFPDIETITAAFESVELEPRFDAILAAGSLEFCADPGKAMQQLVRGLRPGGRGVFVLMVPSRRPAAWLYRLFHASHGVRIHLFSREELVRHAKDSGFRVDSHRAVTFNHALRLKRFEVS